MISALTRDDRTVSCVHDKSVPNANALSASPFEPLSLTRRRADRAIGNRLDRVSARAVRVINRELALS
jgi:hypothetical protein